MNSIQIIGLFEGTDKFSKIKNSIELAKLDSHTLVSQDINQNMHAVSILVKDSFEVDMVRNIFEFYGTIKLMMFENPIDMATIRPYLSARSRAEIVESPAIRKRVPHDGISSELNF